MLPSPASAEISLKDCTTKQIHHLASSMCSSSETQFVEHDDCHRWHTQTDGTQACLSAAGLSWPASCIYDMCMYYILSIATGVKRQCHFVLLLLTRQAQTTLVELNTSALQCKHFCLSKRQYLGTLVILCLDRSQNLGVTSSQAFTCLPDAVADCLHIVRHLALPSVSLRGLF